MAAQKQPSDAEITKFKVKKVRWEEIEGPQDPLVINPHDKRFVCYARVQFEANWKTGELSLCILSADQGAGVLARIAPPLGDFNKTKELSFDQEFKVANNFLSSLRKGGTLNFRVDLTTQTSKGETELKKNPDGGILNRTMMEMPKVISTKIPAPPSANPGPVPVPEPLQPGEED